MPAKTPTQLEYTREWKRRNKDKVRANARRDYAKHRERRNELARDRRSAKLAELAGRPMPQYCDLCGSAESDKRLAFDHCHNSGHFRGWLCARCNTVLGHVEDNATLLRSMAAYLDKNSSGPPFTSQLAEEYLKLGFHVPERFHK